MRTRCSSFPYFLGAALRVFFFFSLPPPSALKAGVPREGGGGHSSSVSRRKKGGGVLNPLNPRVLRAAVVNKGNLLRCHTAHVEDSNFFFTLRFQLLESRNFFSCPESSFRVLSSKNIFLKFPERIFNMDFPRGIFQLERSDLYVQNSPSIFGSLHVETLPGKTRKATFPGKTRKATFPEKRARQPFQEILWTVTLIKCRSVSERGAEQRGKPNRGKGRKGSHVTRYPAGRPPDVGCSERRAQGRKARDSRDLLCFSVSLCLSRRAQTSP